MGEGDRKIIIHIALAGRLQGVQHANIQPVMIQELLLHKAKIGSGRLTLRAPGIAPAGERYRLREGIALMEAVACMNAISGQAMPRGIGHEGAIFAQIRAARMDIAIHQAKRCGSRPAWGGDGADDVHARAPSRRRLYVARGLSTMIFESRAGSSPPGMRASPSKCACGQSEDQSSSSSDPK